MIGGVDLLIGKKKIKNGGIMKKSMLLVAVLLIGGVGISSLWDSNTHKEHQIRKYQIEMADREDKIMGLEDSIRKLNGKIEIYDATWNYLRGVDSIAIDGAIYSIKRVFEYEEQYYYDTSVAVDYKISLS